MAELLPCPCCQKAARRSIAVRNDPIRFATGCSQCPITTGWLPTEAEADAAWNTRPTEQSIRADQTDWREIADELDWFVRRGETLKAEVRTAHSSRGAAASGWMREDDADFRADLEAHLKSAAEALTKLGEATGK